MRNSTIIDDFGEFDSPVNKSEHKEKKAVPVHCDHWTLVDAFNVVYNESRGSELSSVVFVRCAEAFDYLSAQLGLNPIQCIVVALLAEMGKPMSYRMMGEQLGITRLSMMRYTDDLEQLFRRRWLKHCGAFERHGNLYEGYNLTRGVVTAIRRNKCFEPENLKCADTQEFVVRVADKLSKDYDEISDMFSDDKVWLEDIVNENKDLPICKVALGLGNTDVMCLLMLVVADYCNFNGTGNEGIGQLEVRRVYTSENNGIIKNEMLMLQRGTHLLFRKGLVEHKCVDGMADTNVITASDKLKNEILSDFVPEDHGQEQPTKMNGLKLCEDITEKSLFYNQIEGEQVS